MTESPINRELINVVLVEPKESLNIGSVARAMMNLGFSKLHLVSPENFNRKRALTTACWAGAVLDQVQIHESLSSALSEMNEVIGFSGRLGKNRSVQLLLPEWGPTISDQVGKLALVFGPEDNGLSQEHVAHCRLIVRIPSHEECPSFNLAQAVLLVLAEISRGESFAAPIAISDRPTANDFSQLEQIVDRIAREVEFYSDGTPQPVSFVMRSLLRRLAPDSREMGILLGLFGKIERKLERLGRNSDQILS